MAQTVLPFLSMLLRPNPTLGKPKLATNWVGRREIRTLNPRLFCGGMIPVREFHVAFQHAAQTSLTSSRVNLSVLGSLCP